LTGAPTELQKDKAISWSRVLEVRDSLELGSTKILLGIYTYIPPVRADYHACKLVDSSYNSTGDENYIIMDGDKWKLVLQNYKTKNSYGKQVLDVPDELYKLMKEYLKDTPRKYLFTNEHDEPFTRKTFSTWAKRRLEVAFKAPMTLTSIRHVFVCGLDFNVSVRELNEIGRGMGHSVSTQREYRWEGCNEVME
jgi:hypothetical protein